jgi:hypothetical protein
LAKAGWNVRRALGSGVDEEEPQIRAF